ncbi:MAG: 50S ribosomal protein L11 methyltransferase [Bacteroidia bacterium]|nr:50S ribosomal protein L11 methyltransferase [Bacteroidia bacterium]
MTISSTKELTVQVAPDQRDVLIALLGNIGYEGFWEQEDGFQAYLPAEQYDESSLIDILRLAEVADSAYSVKDLADQNWNNSWESNYPPVRIDSFCQIITTFHEKEPDFEYTLHITPKMSFGTGHHATTRLMIKAMKELPLTGTTLLDMGCGTGVLAILAEKLGATAVDAIDFDPWCMENAGENVVENHCEHTRVMLGTKENIPDLSYDVILANINRNVLLADIPAYATHLQPGGILLISGFHPEDVELILQKAAEADLRFSRQWEEDRWVSIQFEKISA